VLGHQGRRPEPGHLKVGRYLRNFVEEQTAHSGQVGNIAVPPAAEEDADSAVGNLVGVDILVAVQRPAADSAALKLVPAVGLHMVVVDQAEGRMLNVGSDGRDTAADMEAVPSRTRVKPRSPVEP
jgi:hypothetical protein